MGRYVFGGIFMLGDVPAGCIDVVESRKGKSSFHMMQSGSDCPGGIIWELPSYGALPYCKETVLVCLGDLLPVWEGSKRFLDWWGIGNFCF